MGRNDADDARHRTNSKELAAAQGPLRRSAVLEAMQSSKRSSSGSRGVDTWSGLLTQVAQRNTASAASTTSSMNASPERLSTFLTNLSKDEEGLSAAAMLKQPITKADMLASLQLLIARDNDQREHTRRRVVSLRTNEERERQAHTNDAEECIENMPVRIVLHTLLEDARNRWTQCVRSRVSTLQEAAAAASTQYQRERSSRKSMSSAAAESAASPRRGSGSSMASVDASSSASADDSSSNEDEEEPIDIGPPSTEALYECLVSGLNSEATQKLVEAELLGLDNDPDMEDSLSMLDATGVEEYGVSSAFRPFIGLMAEFPSLVPPPEMLRAMLAPLGPDFLEPYVPDGHFDASLDKAEAQLDLLLRRGHQPEALRSMLLSGLHPSLRRIAYAKALQLGLTVSDGQPQRSREGNHFPTNYLGAYLGCASRLGKEVVRRGAEIQAELTAAPSSPSSRKTSSSSSLGQGFQGAMTVMLATDIATSVGDCDRFFIYEDEVNCVVPGVLLGGMNLPEMLQRTLTQLGRGTNALDSYVVVRSAVSVEGETHSPTSPNARQDDLLSVFVPLRGVSLLCAPLCNVTGDVAEVAELFAAMTAQIWGRFQGPTPELLQCCWIFESLVAHYALPACVHATRVLRLPPLRLAIEWMVTGFAQLLSPQETLTLWDMMLALHVNELVDRSALSANVGPCRVAAALEESRSRPGARTAKKATTVGESLAPCSLWILPVMAASLFCFRAGLVENCETQEEMRAVFSVGYQIRCRPLIQSLLFTGKC